MKVVIFAGGLGTRLSEETSLVPKPMVDINGRPILWHVMKTYSRYNYNDFIILLGYKSSLIKEYFLNYYLHQSDVRIDLRDNSCEFLNSCSENWSVTLLDTGPHTLTGSRLSLARNYLSDSSFLLTYGDGVSDIDMHKQLEFHQSHNGILTMAAVQPDGRFGTFVADHKSKRVSSFVEKPKGDGAWVNGGFFICDPQIFDHIPENANVAFEDVPMKRLADQGLLYSYHHHGFWKCMDTLRDKNDLDLIAKQATPPWLSSIK
jgi:glucose-1-phosphate cytidylyltransferase